VTAIYVKFKKSGPCSYHCRSKSCLFCRRSF